MRCKVFTVVAIMTSLLTSSCGFLSQQTSYLGVDKNNQICSISLTPDNTNYRASVIKVSYSDTVASSYADVVSLKNNPTKINYKLSDHSSIDIKKADRDSFAVKVISGSIGNHCETEVKNHQLPDEVVGLLSLTLD